MVIVFGATGTVGAYLCVSLSKVYSDNVLAVGHRESDNGFFRTYGINYVSVDISNKQEFIKLPQNDIDVIVHLAGAMPARMKSYCPQCYIDINITGTLNILEYAEKVNLKKIIYAQSISDVDYLCGSLEPINPEAISHFPVNNDHSVYSISKNAAVDLIKHYAAKIEMKYYILRFPNIYVYHPNPYYYVNGEKRMQGYRCLIEQAMKGEPLEIWGNPKRMRDIIYVKDCIQIIENAIITKVAPSGYYNVGTGVGITIEDQIKGIVDVFSPNKSRHSIIYKPEKPDTPQYIFDVNKTRKELNYTPKYDYINYLLDFKLEMENNRFEKLWGTRNY